MKATINTTDPKEREIDWSKPMVVQYIEDEPKPFSESDYFVFDMPHKHALSKPKKPNKGIKIGSYSSKRLKK